MNGNEGCLTNFPQLIIAKIWISELFDEVDPVIDGDLNKLSQVGVEDVFKSRDNSLQWAHLIDHVITFEEVVVLSKLVLDLTDQEISPLNHHVLRDSSMMRLLDFIKVIKFSWKLQDILVGVHEPLFVEVDTLLDEYSSHGN